MKRNNQTESDEEEKDGAGLKVPRSLQSAKKGAKHKKEKKARKKKKKEPAVRKRELKLYYDPRELARSESFNECRLCLDPGVLRTCCGNFYCNKCFYRGTLCPSCGTDVNAMVSISKDDTDPSKNQYGFMPLHILAKGLFAKALVYGVLLGIPIMLLYGFIGKPIETIHGFQCHGIFPSCDLELCTDFHTHVYNHTRWHNKTEGWCTKGTTHCLCSLACIYDPILYSRTEGRLGADYCAPTFNSWAIAMQDHFDKPLFTGKVLDSGRREQMPTTAERWELIDNGVDETFCKAWSGNGSLVFGGEVVHRKIITAPMDLRYGVRVEYRLKYGSDETCLKCCRALFSPGTVSLFFSNNNGPWQAIRTYGIHSYKFGKFEFVREMLPAARLSSHVRFMWIQARFTMHRDWWALDNVTIEGNALPGNWESMESWLTTKAQAQKEMMFAQCCFGTDYCNIRRTLTRFEKAACGRAHPEYDASLPSRLDDGAYAVVGAVFIFLCRIIWEESQMRCRCMRTHGRRCRRKYCFCFQCCHFEGFDDPYQVENESSEAPAATSTRSSAKGTEEHPDKEGNSKMVELVALQTNATDDVVESTYVSEAATVDAQGESKKDHANRAGGSAKRIEDVGSGGETDAEEDEGGHGAQVEEENEGEDEDKITVSYLDFPGVRQPKLQQLFLVVTVLPYVAVALATLFEMWFNRPGALDTHGDAGDGGVLGDMSITTTFDYEPTPWVQKNDFETNQYHKFPHILEHFSIDLLVPRIILPLIAILLDFEPICRAASDVRLDAYLSDFLPSALLACFMCRKRRSHDIVYKLVHHTSRRLDIESTLARDKLIIDGNFDDLPGAADDKLRPKGIIRLSRITNVYGIPKEEVKTLIGVLLFTLIPWGSIAVLVANNTMRAPGLAASILLAIRTVCGHVGFVDIVIGVRQFASWRPLRFYMVAEQMFTRLCIKVSFLCVLSGATAGALIILFMWVGEAPSVELWIPIMIVASGSFLIFGWGLGCSRVFPVRHVLNLTCIDTAVAIRYKETERCCFDCDCCENWALGLCSQEKVAVVFVEDPQELGRWLRAAQMLE